MKISAISISTKANLNSFKSSVHKEPYQPYTQQENREEVQWSTWGDNYAFPIIKSNDSEQENIRKAEIQRYKAPQDMQEETPEEYYKRKLYSIEWTT